MRSSTRQTTALAVAAALLVAACQANPSPAATTSPPASTASLLPVTPSAAPPTGLPSPTGGPTSLTWTKTSGPAETTQLAVPLDYAHPAAGSITLAISRRLAADPAHRIGVLFVNPGGPGAEGVGIPGSPGLGDVIPQAVLDRFDIVAWDPRGVGQSDGIQCPDPSATQRIESLDPTPTTSADVATYRAAFDAAIAQCEAGAGDILPYLAEANSARDMDAIRTALGEATVSYLGWSYGTYLGYLYATMFPTRLRAAVLDGPVDPTQDLVARDLGQARGFERAFGHFLKLCAATKRCPFHGGGDPGKAFDALIAKLEHPGAGATLDAGQAVTGTLSWLYGRDFPGLAAALHEAEAGNGQPLREAADSYYAGVSLGSYEGTVCLDVPHATTTAAIATALDQARKVAPRFGPIIMLGDQYGCLDWPDSGPSLTPGGAPAISGLPPILVVAGTWDPATPPWQAAALAKALGTGVVLTRDGLGHTSGGSATSDPCLRDALVRYLDDLHAPKAGTVCTDGPAFSWP